MRRIFLTGSTGFLGSYLAYYLLKKGFHLSLLVRDSRFQKGEERFDSAVKTLAPDFSIKDFKKQIQFLTGDLTAENLGLKKTAGTWDVLIHCASSTDFSEGNAENLRATNVQGMRAILRFAKNFKIPSFHYISTAYSCGDVKGRVKEKIHLPTSYRSLYEETKNQAERMAFAFCCENDIRLTVHRPSIITGDSVTGRTLNFEGPYLFFKQVVKLCRIMAHRNKKSSSTIPTPHIELPSYAEDEQNIVPVDYVAHFIAEVAAREALEGKIYHITNPEPPTSGDLDKIFQEITPFNGAKFIGDVEFLSKQWDKAIFSDSLRAYWPYLKPRLVFDKTNAHKVEELVGFRFPETDRSYLLKIFNYALASNFGKKPVKYSPKVSARSKHASL